MAEAYRDGELMLSRRELNKQLTRDGAIARLQMSAVMRPIMTQLPKTTSRYWTRMAFPTLCSCSRAFSEWTTIISSMRSGDTLASAASPWFSRQSAP
jgi:hypothetical protein